MTSRAHVYQCPFLTCRFAASGKHSLSDHLQSRHTTIRHHQCLRAGCTFATVYPQSLRDHLERRHAPAVPAAVIVPPATV